MDKRTAIIAILLTALAIWLLGRMNTHKELRKSEDTVIDGLPGFEYIVPPLSQLPGGLSARKKFDWIDSDCSCAISPTKPLIVDSIRLAPRPTPGYTYTAPPILPYQSALKNAGVFKTSTRTLISAYEPPPLPAQAPAPPVFVPPPPTFSWEWTPVENTFERNIRTSDGALIPAGPFQNDWVRADNGSILDPITVIRYNGQNYRLA